MYRKISPLFLYTLVAAVATSNIASAGLVGWWKFDETSGTVAKDSSGQGNDGKIVGNAQWTAGTISGALQFDGNTYVNCGNKASLNFRNQVTVSFWFKVAAFVNGWEAFLAKGDGAFRASRSAETGNSVHFAISGGNNFDATTTVTDDQWHHYCGTYDGAIAIIYLDGKVDAYRAYTGMIGDSSGYNLYIGANSQQTGRLLHGLLDDVRIYDKALTAPQLQDLIGKGISPTWNKAERPTPANGALGVVTPLFTWNKGDTAVFHNVYLGTSPEFTAADLKAARYIPTTYPYVLAPLLPGTIYYWRVDEIEADAVTTYTGDVWSFVTQAVTAYYPNPADGANTASTSPTLTWMAGTGATQHHAYFGDSLDAVTQGAAGTDKGTLALADATFAPGALEPLTTYYWRVDEIQPGNAVKTGLVWKFTTAQIVDDFESYTDQAGSEIFSTWIDDYGAGLNGSTVGKLTSANGTYGETTIVHGGTQSMPMDYNNVASPFYSEAERDFGANLDWTADGIDTLVLYVQGRLINSPAQLYVAIEDASKNVAIAAYSDPGILTTMKWTEWKIPLSGFTGVNLGKVKKMYIGVGDRNSPVKGGTGRIFIDDICLTKP